MRPAQRAEVGGARYDPPMDPRGLRADLLAEQAALDDVVASLTVDRWATATPSPGWTVADQIGHLWYFDRAAVTAIEDPEAFSVLRDELIGAALEDPSALDRLSLADARALEPAQLLESWRRGRAELATASERLVDGDRVPWFGPSMGAASFLTARLMEVWAHGQDVVDALDAERPPTDRLVHVAQLGVITRSWSYLNRGLEPPTVPVHVELRCPSGAVRTWGDDAAQDSVRGDLEDFCLVVTQRRHVDDTALEVTGAAAREWMTLAQAFAGGATEGPPVGGRAG